MVNLQRELPGQMLFEVGYMGSQSRRLESLRSVNEAKPAPRSTGRACRQFDSTHPVETTPAVITVDGW
jgi:hypothetical protein